MPRKAVKTRKTAVFRRKRRLLCYLYYLQVTFIAREYWVHGLNLDRPEKGEFYVLYPDLRMYPHKFFRFYRMSVERFDQLLSKIHDQIVKKKSNYREPISPEHRLVLTLSYLSSGCSYANLATRFRVGVSTVSVIVKETCDAVWDKLAVDYCPIPKRADWQRIEHGFSTKWNFPNCVGALDGKHVVIQAPNKSGSLYYNYKGTFSIVLMALVDADYKFTYVDIGNYGHNADGSIFGNSDFGQAFMNDELDFPPPKTLPNFPNGGPFPHCIVADEAFPLKYNLLRPYPRGRNQNRLTYMQRLFNYRLSRARRIVENAFGILVQRWRIFDGRICLAPQNVDRVVKACIVLHNYLMGESRDLPAIFDHLNPDHDVYNQDNGAILAMERVGNRARLEAQQIRDGFANYFTRPEGAVVWQGRAMNNQ